jgi:hypothetical protein
MQILGPQQVDPSLTMRQRAINQGLEGITQGFMNYQQGQRTQRQEALAQEKADQALTMELNKSGFKGSVDDFKKAVSSKDPALHNAFFSNRTDEYNRKLNQQMEDKKLSREKDQSVINKNNRYQPKSASSNVALNPDGTPMTWQQKQQEQIRLQTEAKTAEETRQRNDPHLKLEKLGGEGRGKVGALASGFQAIDTMMKAMDDNYGPEYVNGNSSIIGGIISDNPYTESERVLTEVTGRLQSGGAIGGEELKTFRAMGPKPGDNLATRKRKIGQQRDFLQNKLTAFGMNLDDLTKLGFETTSKYVPRNKTQSPNTQVKPEHVNAVKAMSDEELLKFVQGG